MEPYRRKVRYWDVDANAHVFNPRFLIYVDDALTDFLEDAGVGFAEHEKLGCLTVLAHAEIDYRSEAVVGETLLTSVTIETVGNTSITFGFEIVEERSARLVATGREVYVIVDAVERKPIPVPDQIRSRLDRDLLP